MQAVWQERYECRKVSGSRESREAAVSVVSDGNVGPHLPRAATRCRRSSSPLRLAPH